MTIVKPQLVEAAEQAAWYANDVCPVGVALVAPVHLDVRVRALEIGPVA
ncbi:MAG: hypothetical protein ACRDKK_02845 [Gaiellaceae bacterium]